MSNERANRVASRNLAIASITLGSIGAVVFVLYKLSNSSKNSLVGHGSKILIAIGIICLAISVLLLSQNYDSFRSPLRDNRNKREDRSKKRRRVN